MAAGLSPGLCAAKRLLDLTSQQQMWVKIDLLFGTLADQHLCEKKDVCARDQENLGLTNPR
jgi:hypothetical protein